MPEIPSNFSHFYKAGADRREKPITPSTTDKQRDFYENPSALAPGKERKPNLFAPAGIPKFLPAT